MSESPIKPKSAKLAYTIYRVREALRDNPKDHLLQDIVRYLTDLQDMKGTQPKAVDVESLKDDDKIGEPVLYSDGQISREIEEYPTSETGDVGSVKEYVFVDIIDGIYEAQENMNTSLDISVDMARKIIKEFRRISNQAAELSQKDKRIAELELAIEKEIYACAARSISPVTELIEALKGGDT